MKSIQRFLAYSVSEEFLSAGRDAFVMFLLWDSIFHALWMMFK